VDYMPKEIMVNYMPRRNYDRRNVSVILILSINISDKNMRMWWIICKKKIEQMFQYFNISDKNMRM
jgi:hypothetical protein